MHVILSLAGHIVVHHHGDVVDIDAAGHDVGGHQHIDAAGAEGEHYLLALVLIQVGVHLGALDAGAAKRTVQLLDLQFGGHEDYDTLGGLGLQQMLEHRLLLRLVDYGGALLDGLGRTGDGGLDLYGMVQEFAGQLLDLRGHRGREHHGLTPGGQVLGDGHDVIEEAHVQHAVRLVQDEERHLRQVAIPHLQMRQESAGGGDDHVGALLQTMLLLGETAAVGTAVNGERGDRQIVGEPLHLVVYLHGEFARGGHDDAVDGVRGIIAVSQPLDYGQQVSGRLAGTGLGDSHEVLALQRRRNGHGLDGGALVEVHGVKCVEYVVS